MATVRTAVKTATFRLVICFALLALLGNGASSPLFGQFNGPSLGGDTPVNTPLTPTTDPAILYPADHPLKIGVGDSLNVHIFGVAPDAPAERVSLDGTVQVPLIQPVPVLGLTLYQASQEIAHQLQASGMYRDPQVTIQLGESPNQLVTFAGELHNVVPIFGRRTLLSAISAAGGFTATSSHTIVINRPGVSQSIVVPLGNDPSRSTLADVPVFPGDTVIVPRIGVVYLLGAFKAQGAIPLQQNTPLTLMQATSLGGGVLYEGKYKDLRVIRTVGFERKVIKLDIQKVMHGKVADPVLQADDIVFLPSNSFKAALTNGGFGAATSVASLLLVAFQSRSF